jgi:hypothetical protein
MLQYDFIDLPNIDKPELLALCLCTQDLRRATVDLIQQVVRQRPQGACTLTSFVCLAILNRMAEGSLSCEILAAKNRGRDLAILVLSLYELQLDLQYIALEQGREDIWITHAKENRKPWRVQSQLEEVFLDIRELAAEKEVYRRLSMVKHCNPAAETFAFPVATRQDALVLDMRTENSALVGAHLFGLGVCLCRAANAAIHMLLREGFDLAPQELRFSELDKRLTHLIEKQLISILQESSRTQDAGESR